MPADACLPGASSRAGDGVHPSQAQRLLLRVIRGYQLFLSPMYAGSCRYLPSCSAYAAEAIERHGAIRGSGLAIRRLLRCHPFGGHGHDPVPAFAPAEFRRGEPLTHGEGWRGEPKNPAGPVRGQPQTPAELRLAQPLISAERQRDQLLDPDTQ